MSPRHGVDSVRRDERLATHRLARGAEPRVREMRGDAAFVLKKSGEAHARPNRVGSEFSDDGVVDDLLQPPAMNGELRVFEARIGASRLAPDLLAEPIYVDQFLGADGDRVERGQETEHREFLDRVRQSVDADADFADLARLFVDDGLDAALVQHQRQGQPADAAARDEDGHLSSPRKRGSSRRVRTCGRPLWNCA